MKKFVKPYAIVLYLFSFMVFFMAGMLYTGITGAAEGQGLAGGAIVFMNGLSFAVAAFIVAVFAVNYAAPGSVRITNIILLVVFAGLIFYFGNKHARKIKEKPLSVNSPAHAAATLPVTIVYSSDENADPIQDGEEIGLGYFKPDFFSQPVLYFYGNPNYEKSVSEHSPVDSIVFERQEYGGFDIEYAPPWLQPHHLKLDYDILYFKIISIGHEFLKVIVNTSNQKMMVVSRFSGRIIFWPEFLLGVSSIEFLPGQEQTIKVKPLIHAGEVMVADYSHMEPLLVEGDWIKVLLKDKELRKITTGWIRWRSAEKLLIKFSLLS